jgi:hypothetical protein
VDHANREILVHFEVKMRRIKAMRIPNGPNLLAASNLLTFPHQDSIKMGIERISIPYLTFFHKGVPDNDDIPPSTPKIPGERDDSISSGVNRIAKICSAAPLPNPVFAKMPMRGESSRDPITACVRFADRKIKAVCESCQGCIRIRKRSCSDEA